MKPEFPVYIPSKGRAAYCMTMKTLDAMGVPYFVIIEKAEYDEYRLALEGTLGRLLVLDPAYQRDYETCDNLGDTKSKGPGPARNFAWAHSIDMGHAWHWVMDDNIRNFYRLHDNKKIRVADGTVLKCMEDFVRRYLNVAMAGPNYHFFAKRKQKLPPYILNTRIYSCNLIRNDVRWRWRGRYNEDTDLSLCMLKDGYCTVQFNAFLQGKIRTSTMPGGNTAAFYDKEGTINKSLMLAQLHPDCVRLLHRFQREHHYVDYKRFKQTLRRKPGLVVGKGANEYGMAIKSIAAP